MEPRAKTFNAGEVPKPRKYMPPPSPRLEMSMTKLPDGICRYVRVVPTVHASQPVMVSRVKKQGRQQKCRWISTTSVAATPAVPSPEIASPLAAMGSRDDGFAGDADPVGTIIPLAAINALGSRQNSFIPYTVRVKPGQDIIKIVCSLGQNGHVSVLSANGVVSRVELYQSTISTGVTTYEGHFEILRLSGLLSEAGGLRVLLAGPNCQVFGGRLAGFMIIVASPIQRINMIFAGSRQNSFIPYTIKVKLGQDIIKILCSFGQNGHVSVLSANGVVSRVELHQSTTSSGVTTYEGHFEILRLTGLLSKAGGLRVLLAGPNCQVFGGHLAGIMIAASPVQMIVGNFTTDDC